MDPNPHIRVLPLHVANKIAAGEVVERPASVVKELAENAIDAGAKNIRISIVQGGRNLISVQDDGCGMSRDDAVLSLERHATSKIRDVDDIENIGTLGFRGEAIPSIASVSRFTITTRTLSSDEGTRLAVNAGVLAEIKSAGCPPGTIVEVRDLFCNVPARRKFLRACATEESHIREIFTFMALAHRDVSFSLTIDGRETYKLAQCKDLGGRIADLFGAETLERLLEIDASIPGQRGETRAHGFIERPDAAQCVRREQFTFVNSRPASCSAIAYALREAYPRKQGDCRPMAVLFVDVPPKDVDVNVHPAKREVRLRNASAAKEAIRTAIEEALKHPAARTQTPPETRTQKAAVPDAGPAARQLPAKEPEPAPLPAPKPVAPPPPEPVQVEFAIEPGSTDTRPWKWFKFLAQLSSGYLLIETDMGYITVNPKAAIARIAYEKAMDGKSAVQMLLVPETVRLSPVSAMRISSSLGELASAGFELEPFGNDTFKVEAVPQAVGKLSVQSVIETIAHDMIENSARRSSMRSRGDVIARSIARSLAGANTILDENTARRLVEDLVKCRMPYVSPQGKPVMIFTSTRELDRRFDR